MNKKTIMKEKSKIKKEKPVKPVENKTNNDTNDMSINEITTMLVELSRSKYWPALVSITNGWKLTIESGLKTIDPFKEPTLVARAQGQLLALNFLESTIKAEIDRLNKIENNNTPE